MPPTKIGPSQPSTFDDQKDEGKIRRLISELEEKFGSGPVDNIPGVQAFKAWDFVGDTEVTEVSSVIKTHKDGLYSDRMVLKFQAGDPIQKPVVFTLQDGTVVDKSQIRLQDYMVEPVGRLYDVWDYKGQWFPKYLLHSCVLIPRKQWEASRKHNKENIAPTVPATNFPIIGGSNKIPVLFNNKRKANTQSGVGEESPPKFQKRSKEEEELVDLSGFGEIVDDVSGGIGFR